MGLSLKKLGSIGAGILRQVNPLDNGRTYQQTTPTNQGSIIQQVRNSGAGHVAAPVVNLGTGLVHSVGQASAVPLEVGRSVVGQATGNQAAQDAAARRAKTDVTAGLNLVRAIPIAAYQFGESINPVGGNVEDRSHTFTNPITKTVFGSAPIPSMQAQYKQDVAEHGKGYAASAAATTAVMDALGGRGAVEGAAKLRGKVTSKPITPVDPITPQQAVHEATATLKNVQQLHDDAHAQVNNLGNPVPTPKPLTNVERKAIKDGANQKIAEANAQLKAYKTATDLTRANFQNLDKYDAPHTELVPTSEALKYMEHDRAKKPMMTADQYAALRDDISKNGIKEPLTLNYGAKDRIATVGEGNHRLAIAKELGIEEVPMQVSGTQLSKAFQDEYKAGYHPVPGREPDQFGYVPSNQKPSDIGVKTATPPANQLSVIPDRSLATTPKEPQAPNNKVSLRGSSETIRSGQPFEGDPAAPHENPPRTAPRPSDEDIINATSTPAAVTPKTLNKVTKHVDIGNIGGARDQFGKLMVDEDTPLINLLKRIDSANHTKNGDTFMFNSSLQRNAPKIAHSYFMRSADMQEAIGGLNKNARDEFAQYASARRELANAREGLKTSAPTDELRQIYDAGHEAYGARYDALNRYYKGLAEGAEHAGLISKETLAHYAKDNDYIRLQRDMGDLVERPASNRSYRRGSTTATQKRTGSERTVIDPVSTALDYTRRITGEELQNTTAAHLIKTMHDAGQTRRLINADDVAARREAFANMAELKPVKEALRKEVSRTTKALRNLTSRNKELSPKIMTGIQKGEKPTRDGAIRKANDAERSQGSGKKLAKMPTKAHIEEAFQEYLDGNPRLVRQMQEFLGNKNQQEVTIARLERLKRDYQNAKTASKNEWLTAKQHADLPTKNKNTVSFMRNGIKETHEVHAEVKKAMENIKPYELGLPGKIVGAPARILRAGATALNPVFAASNIVKDQVGSAVISSKARATHTPSAFVSGLKNSSQAFVGSDKMNPLWHEFEKVGGDITQYDLTRNVKGSNEIIARKAGGRKIGAYQAAIHAVRTLEDANSITEKATRFQNFKGIYEDSIKQGRNHEQAVQDATLAALTHTVNFGRAGSAGRILNLIIPYSNAAIQGGRTLGNATKNHPYSTVSKGFAWVGTPVAAATIWNTSDPERKKIYENIRPFEKQNNLIFISPHAKYSDVKNGSYAGVIKIPLPPDIGSIFQPIRRGIESAVGAGTRMTAKEAIADVTKPFVGPLDVSSVNGLVSSATPQAIKVPLNQAANKDFYTGKQIVPDYMKDATSDPTKRVTPFTSSTARILSEAIDKYTGKKVEPVRIDKLATDIGGKLGSFGINASDHALAATGNARKDPKTGKDIIGGQDTGTAYVQRFSRASATEDPNNQAAAYFKKVTAQYSKLDKNERAAYDALHPTKVDGNAPDKTLYDASVRAGIYSKYPKVLAADNAVNKDSKDPFYHLPSPQQKVILTLDSLSNDPGSATAKEVSKQNPWLQDYYDQRSAFFDDLVKTGKIKASNGSTLPKAPIATGDTKSQLDEYSSITDSKAKATYIQDHPAVSDFFASTDDYQRKKREILGLPQFDKYPTASAAVQKKLALYNSLPQHDGKKGGNASRSAYLAANPDVTDYFAAASQYGIIKDAQTAQFENEDLSDKSIAKISGGSSSFSSSGSSRSSNGPSDYNARQATANPFAHVVKARGTVKTAPKVTAHITSRRAKVATKRKSTITTKLTKAKA